MRFFKFFTAWVLNTWASFAGYHALVSPELMKIRHNRCQRCKFYQDGGCLKCGCLIEAKIMLATEKCPIDKWRRVWIKRKRPTKA